MLDSICCLRCLYIAPSMHTNGCIDIDIRYIYIHIYIYTYGDDHTLYLYLYSGYIYIYVCVYIYIYVYIYISIHTYAIDQFLAKCRAPHTELLERASWNSLETVGSNPMALMIRGTMGCVYLYMGYGIYDIYIYIQYKYCICT